jgi:hypothetical protein
MCPPTFVAFPNVWFYRDRRQSQETRPGPAAGSISPPTTLTHAIAFSPSSSLVLSLSHAYHLPLPLTARPSRPKRSSLSPPSLQTSSSLHLSRISNLLHLACSYLAVFFHRLPHHRLPLSTYAPLPCCHHLFPLSTHPPIVFFQHRPPSSSPSVNPSHYRHHVPTPKRQNVLQMCLPMQDG